ncbi:MAG: precorrin-4 C(11)-methyltransferase [Desulfohalobiaceae bacterium]
MSPHSHAIFFIGAGPGDPELITVKAQRILARADAVLYAGSLVPLDILQWCRSDAEIVDSASMTLDQTHAFLRDHQQSGRLVARVHTGDPALYGAIREQIHLLEEEGLPYEIVPGITAAFAAAAKAGVSYTLPERTQSLILTRAEGRTPVPDKEALNRLAEHEAAMAIYLSAGNAGKVQRQLLDGGYSADTPVVIAYRVGWPEERILKVRLEDMAETAEREEITRQALFLILPGQEEEPVFSRLYSPDFAHGYRG